jgi:hypothetical protein
VARQGAGKQACWGPANITADQVLGCAEACERLAVCPLATLELGCNTSCILACAPAAQVISAPTPTVPFAWAP